MAGSPDPQTLNPSILQPLILRGLPTGSLITFHIACSHELESEEFPPVLCLGFRILGLGFSVPALGLRV